MPSLQFSSLRLLATFAAAAALTGCQCFAPVIPGNLLPPRRAIEGPHIRPIDRACLPVGISPPEIPLYHGDVMVRRAEIAYIDSFASNMKDPQTVKAQLEDLQNKARLTGADAVIRVRPLNHEIYGFVNDPNTPFPSVMQGGEKRSFYRGTAIKYQEAVVGEPARVEPPAPPPLPPGAVQEPREGGRFVPIPFSSPTGTGPAIGGADATSVPQPSPLGTAANPVR